jgi:hypothetical protein
VNIQYPMIPTLARALGLLLFCCSQLKAQNALLNDGNSIYLESAASIYIQGNLENKSTGSFTNSGSVYISGNLIHNGSGNLNATNTGIFRFNGTGNQTISGSKQPDFYNLTLDKSSGELQLQTGFSLSNHLTFTSGKLFLNNQHIDLLNSGQLINETATNSIYDNATGTGTIKIVQTLNAPSAVNPGNLGAIITSTQNLASTTIIRGHAQQFIVSANSITRYYDITPSMNTGLNATLRFNYLDTELNSQPEDELVQWHSSMSNGVWTKRGGTVNMSSDNVILSTIDTFSRVSLISHKILPLPLKLLMFTATKTSFGKTLLQWKTAEEIGCSHFNIERSEDGRQWTKIGITPALGQQGAIQSYQFTDQSPVNGSNYYRLKQVDLDGRYDYSPVRLINFGNQTSVSIYPTLIKGNSTLFIAGISPENILVELYDNNGKLLSKTKLYSNSIQLPQLPVGTYHVKVINLYNRQIVTTQQILVY